MSVWYKYDLKGIKGDNRKAILAADARSHEPLAYRGNQVLVTYLQLIVSAYWNFIAQNLKLTF
jgi:hypothetical protein